MVNLAYWRNGCIERAIIHKPQRDSFPLFSATVLFVHKKRDYCTLKPHLLHIIRRPISYAIVRICKKRGLSYRENVKRVRRVQCVPSYKRLEYLTHSHVTHVSHYSASALEIDQWKSMSCKLKTFGRQISVCNNRGCMHLLNLIIFSRERGGGTDFECNEVRQ